MDDFTRFLFETGLIVGIGEDEENSEDLLREEDIFKEEDEDDERNRD